MLTCKPSRRRSDDRGGIQTSTAVAATLDNSTVCQYRYRHSPDASISNPHESR